MSVKLLLVPLVALSMNTTRGVAASVLSIASTPGVDQVQLVPDCDSLPDPEGWHNAVETWVHPAWPTIEGAFWISSSFLIGEEGSPIAGDSWRWFRRIVEVPLNSEITAGNLGLTADNAEEVWVNGIWIGSDGEVCGAHEDNLEWDTIQIYDMTSALLPGINEILVLVRNYPGSDIPEDNPTGLIYYGEIEYEESAFVEVIVDIKPGSFPNSINLRSKGAIAVGILSAIDFNATAVDPLTVALAGAPVALKKNGTPMAGFEDLNGDGFLDLVVHIRTQDLQLSETDTEAVLEGALLDGTLIRGADSVRVVR